MTQRVIEHKIKLEKSMMIILAALAFGVLANAFVPAFDVESVFAAPPQAVKSKLPVRIVGPVEINLSGSVRCVGCEAWRPRSVDFYSS